MEETTTVAPPETGAGALAQPADGAQQSAAQPQEPQQSQGQPAQADDTAAWLASKGVDPTDPEAFQKIAQMAYNSEKQMTRATMEASELRKSLTQPTQQPEQGVSADPMSEFIQDYRRDKLINGFKESHPDWHDHEPAMVKALSEATPSGYTRSQLVNAGLLSLEDVYAMAKASAPVNTDQVRAQAQHEVLQTLANTQRAGGSTAQASNSNPQTPVDDPFMRGIKMSRGK